MKSKTTLVLVLVLLVSLCAIAVGCGRGVGGEEIGGGQIGGGPASACGAAGPRVEAVPAEAAPNEVFGLRGIDFANYSSSDGVPQQECPRPLPVEGIQIEFVQGQRTWELATVASGEDLSFDAGGLKVPADASPGEAVVRATSPSVDPNHVPPFARTPFRVLPKALPGTGAKGDHDIQTASSAW